MFSKRWRTYPLFLQLTLFGLTLFTLFWFGNFIVLATIPKLSGYSIKEIIALKPESERGLVLAALATQSIWQVFTFVVPALMFAIFTHPRVGQYLGLRTPGKSVHWLYVTGIMLGLIPVLLWGQNWMVQNVHLGNWADQLTKQYNNKIGAFLKLNKPSDVLLLLGSMALLPAVGEELVFRGIFLRLLHRRVVLPYAMRGIPVGSIDNQRVMVFPVVFTSILFAAFHTLNPYGFAFIFSAGCVLALIYFLTGSLWCSIWGHFLYNGSQILAVFYGSRSEAVKQIVESNNIPAVYPLVGLVLFVGCFYMLVKSQTPLAPDWSDDFKGEIIGPEKPIL